MQASASVLSAASMRVRGLAWACASNVAPAAAINATTNSPLIAADVAHQRQHQQTTNGSADQVGAVELADAARVRAQHERDHESDQEHRGQEQQARDRHADDLAAQRRVAREARWPTNCRSRATRRGRARARSRRASASAGISRALERGREHAREDIDANSRRTQAEERDRDREDASPELNRNREDARQELLREQHAARGQREADVERPRSLCARPD